MSISIEEVCYLDNNELEGALPGWSIGKLRLLRKCILLGIRFRCNAAHLNWCLKGDFQIYNNKLEGPLPPEVGNLQFLRKHLEYMTIYY